MITTIKYPRSTCSYDLPRIQRRSIQPYTQALIGAILLLLLSPVVAHAQSGTLAPAPFQTFLDNSGKIVNGGCVWTYTAGTTTAVATYTDVNLSTPNANPIKSGPDGRFSAYLVPGQSYKFVYENIPCSAIAHGSTLKTVDNIAAVPVSGLNVDVTGTAGEALTAGQCAYLSDGSGGKTAGQWYRCDSTNTYSSTTAGVIGFATSAASSAGSGSFRTSGRLTGLAGLTVGAAYYVGSTGAITSTAPSNLRLVGKADSTTSLLVPNTDQATPSATVQTTALTGTQNNFVATAARRLVLYANNATALTLTGLTAGQDGDTIDVIAYGAGTLTLSSQDTGSTAGNRLVVPNGGGLVVTTARLVYDLTSARWRVMAYAPTPTFTYPATVANVINTTTSTPFLTFTVPSMADGDVLDVGVPVLRLNNSGGAVNFTLSVIYGGVTGSASAVSWAANATEFGDLVMLHCQRVGADLWCFSQAGDASPTSVISNAPTSRGNLKFTVAAPTFTASQTVTVNATFGSASANTYLKVASTKAVVTHTRAQ